MADFSLEDLQKYKVPLKWRDRCAAYYALYLSCQKRGDTDCHHDKVVWEECQYLDLERRRKELEEMKAKRREELANKDA
ncbi:uncharacterized protein KQ657_002627 [Scheffersomyces spartinae]|uniref:NADH dehydrogenase [ubiquinone] 1 beta subcomplex subunit 7 n=1 Tax=Scheffersomyces spartinae TaxID=45513 RepID=A0A9P7V613_9ASCO|nr:uncharacterized protein KQ657_002627 [Scheffersomyces spartinae]KAG7192019.1 hypothetical protein KQ657_002627 [Scheffersomyces spartinae]